MNLKPPRSWAQNKTTGNYARRLELELCQFFARLASGYEQKTKKYADIFRLIVVISKNDQKTAAVRNNVYSLLQQKGNCFGMLGSGLYPNGSDAFFYDFRSQLSGDGRRRDNGQAFDLIRKIRDAGRAGNAFYFLLFGVYGNSGHAMLQITPQYFITKFVAVF